MNDELSELLKVRRDKLNEFKAQGMGPFPFPFEKDNYAAPLLEKFQTLKEGDESPSEVRVTGRVMTKRGHGKAAFATIQDETGRIQVYGKLDLLGEQKYELYQKLDLGDIIGVKGKIFKTKTGEVSIKLSDFTLLCKSLHPLPEKWHGLQDKEIRYRERYVDLIVNPEVKDVFVKRSKVVSLIRHTLEDKGFIEVETPILHIMQGGAAAKPFETFHDALNMPLFMRIAPELYLKRLLVGGFEKVYEMGRVFRNEGMSYKHNPEYTMIEIYQAFADYNNVMALTEELVVTAAKAVAGSLEIEFRGEKINLAPPWKRISLLEALKEHGVDIGGKSEAEIRKIGKERG